MLLCLAVPFVFRFFAADWFGDVVELPLYVIGWFYFGIPLYALCFIGGAVVWYRKMRKGRTAQFAEKYPQLDVLIPGYFCVLLIVF